MVNPALAVLKFVYEKCDSDDGMDFIHYWYEADFDACRQLFPRAPEECYIGADASHPETQKLLREQQEKDDALQAIDIKAQAGLCQMTHGGTREFLKDIRTIVAVARGEKENG
jgi:hypothetical protein